MMIKLGVKPERPWEIQPATGMNPAANRLPSPPRHPITSPVWLGATS